MFTLVLFAADNFDELSYLRNIIRLSRKHLVLWVSTPGRSENTSRYSRGSVEIPGKLACDKIWVITFSAIKYFLGKCLDKIPCIK